MTQDDATSVDGAVMTSTALPSEMESIFNSITDALFVYDSVGRLVRTNATARTLLGLADDDQDYASIPMRERVARANLRTPDGTPLPEHAWVLPRLLSGKAIASDAAVDVLLRRPDGSDALIAFTGAPIRDSAGAIIGAVAVGRDETERRRLEIELRAANSQLATATTTLAQQASSLQTVNKRMDQFLGMANHEMKTPLTSLTANLQLAARRLRRLARSTDRDASSPLDVARMSHETDAVLAILARAQSAARRMTRLVNELLDVSRIHTGRMEAHPEPCDLLALTRSVIDEMRHTHPDRVIRLEANVEQASVLADPDRISEVIDNYLSNATKYSPADTPITVALTMPGDGTARVSVRDEGQGISPETQARIWDVFERLDAEAPQRAHGINLGLGLHICKTIVALHCGEVGVESAVGAGSTFWFTLPIAPAAPTTDDANG